MVRARLDAVHAPKSVEVWDALPRSPAGKVIKASCATMLRTIIREIEAIEEETKALIDKSQEAVTGSVRLKLYKGGVHVIGRESPYSLYSQDLVTFEEGAVAYDHRDAAGFIKLNALRLRTLGSRKRKLGV